MPGSDCGVDLDVPHGVMRRRLSHVDALLAPPPASPWDASFGAFQPLPCNQQFDYVLLLQWSIGNTNPDHEDGLAGANAKEDIEAYAGAWISRFAHGANLARGGILMLYNGGSEWATEWPQTSARTMASEFSAWLDSHPKVEQPTSGTFIPGALGKITAKFTGSVNSHKVIYAAFFDYCQACGLQDATRTAMQDATSAFHVYFYLIGGVHAQLFEHDWMDVYDRGTSREGFVWWYQIGLAGGLDAAAIETMTRHAIEECSGDPICDRNPPRSASLPFGYAADTPCSIAPPYPPPPPLPLPPPFDCANLTPESSTCRSCQSQGATEYDFGHYNSASGNSMHASVSLGSAVAGSDFSGEYTISMYARFSNPCPGSSDNECELLRFEPTGASAAFQVIGCYSDRYSDPDFGQRMTYPRDPEVILVESIEECSIHCQEVGTKFFAMRSDACACTDTFGRHGQLSDSNCDYTGAIGCGQVAYHRGPTNSCGGYSRNTIYSTLAGAPLSIRVRDGKIVYEDTEQLRLPYAVYRKENTFDRRLNSVETAASNFHDGRFHHIIAQYRQNPTRLTLAVRSDGDPGYAETTTERATEGESPHRTGEWWLNGHGSDQHAAASIHSVQVYSGDVVDNLKALDVTPDTSGACTCAPPPPPQPPLPPPPWLTCGRKWWRFTRPTTHPSCRTWTR